MNILGIAKYYFVEILRFTHSVINCSQLAVLFLEGFTDSFSTFLVKDGCS